jgi:hypothetical protein
MQISQPLEEESDSYRWEYAQGGNVGSEQMCSIFVSRLLLARLRSRLAGEQRCLG